MVSHGKVSERSTTHQPLSIKQLDLENIMKTKTAFAASLALAGMICTTGVFADEPIKATVNSIDRVYINDDDNDACRLQLNITTYAGQNAVVNAEASGTQLCLSLEGKFLTAAQPFEGAFLINPFVSPIRVILKEICQEASGG